MLTACPEQKRPRSGEARSGHSNISGIILLSTKRLDGTLHTSVLSPRDGKLDETEEILVAGTLEFEVGEIGKSFVE